MEYDAECAVLLQQSVSSDSKRFRELASRLDALELPRDTHYLFYERLNGLEEVALAETARFLDVSEPYLSRRFHRETGRTLVDYLNHIRIDRARLLLSSSGHLRVHRVAELCGFSNAHYFALRFKKEVGMTPLEFQKRMRAYLYQGNQEARI
ncbi:helix-turn-helix transcriptional regulator [Anaerotruncus massiliensis (ex Liu et al. 2021)]|jgi:two component transcriptional regulator, araC family|uniref:helix-turn-helix transcriptional regulator n=1 Tax=Anaerotruncus massiliensis (ex Liu et al. 2021) TaxID=2321404 RepID=UPI00208C7217|nr:hypothetical protein CE91St45_20760 [Oscillospiraceae bacterium]